MPNTFNALEVLEHDSSKKNFYPTPKSLAERLLQGVVIPHNASLLEPSAGKGDLLEAVFQHMLAEIPNYARMAHGTRIEYLKEFDVDCVEVDPNLRSILTGKGWRVVHDDFLTFETQKRYGFIVMNPPFDRGAEHLLKAFDVLRRGGTILCILNAETLRNPYSNARKDLAAKLAEYNAQVEFVDEAFTTAERKTDVSVALIRVFIPAVEVDSSIMEGMKEAPTYTTPEVPQQYAELVQYNQIDEWVNRFNFEVACGIRLIEEYEALKPHMLTDPSASKTYQTPLLVLSVNAPRDERCRTTMINDYIRQTRRKYWRAIFQQKTFTDRLTLINGSLY